MRSGAILAVIDDDSPFAEADVARATEEAAIDVAVEGAVELMAALRL